eukprot:TRINITY_DN2034_c0_g3_i1.p1 TRINITY_DN2034_c0_g3~~TRINITY_DN2034_c0_g3_i1.p1  ORF type:complete len:464 (+),score=125.98 TRINITY_DN2034_c0_g3_i1:168-1559(+)
MGCGVSHPAGNPQTAPGAWQGPGAGYEDKPKKDPRTPAEDNDSDYDSSAEEYGAVEKPGVSLTKVPDDIAEEMFSYGDFLIDLTNPDITGHTQANGSEQKKKKGPHRLLAKTKVDTQFEWGDACVEIGDDTVEEPPDRKRELSEYHIKAYECYSLIGHSARVKCICVSPNEGFFISCSNEDPNMTLRDIETAKEIMSFHGHDDTIISACFSNDAKYLATTSRDNTMILWDVTSGKQTLTFEHEKVVISCCFSRDSKFLVSGCQDKGCRIWETKKGREQNSFMDHDGLIISVSFSPDGTSVLSSSADKTLRIWRTSDAAQIHCLRGHTGIVLSSAYRSDGKCLVSNDERVLKVWDATSGVCMLSLSVDEVPRPNTQPGKKQTWTLSTFCPGHLGYYIIAACNSKTVHVFHPENGDEILALYCKAPVYCLSCGQTSKVAFGDSYGNVFIATLYAAGEHKPAQITV